MASDVVLPALLRATRGSYGAAIRARLAEGGFDDLPRNGPYVLGGLVNHGGSARQLVRELGVGKQAAAQLVDTLVARGYLTREPDVTATERGRAAAAAIRAAVKSVDDELATLITGTELAGLRAGLVALTEIRERLEDVERGSAVG
ncbi:helix-turn-helix domain-containing protein [Amycolatopsis sp., V23-08]|uniref:Helix-turn-helix domain-containing protein n=1 Tax=Amycolatopsis heterodermiae TaxID=3110235 RepID=A0ABU5R2T0_9PSEU|nr:helix-turn-helix domain-containing protein [Amycolatopsis sp., V23-08]MEA5360155.1 helix-turn-helix domain-containing protein [Amycolatopsis sp., V23-08]